IGPDTVNTVPAGTFAAFADHGQARASLTEKGDEAGAMLAALAAGDISLEPVGERLLGGGGALVNDAFDERLAALERKREQLLGAKVNRQEEWLPAPLQASVRDALNDWRRGGKLRRLFAGDATLWTGGDEGRWLGWLDITEDRLAHRAELDAVAA